MKKAYLVVFIFMIGTTCAYADDIYLQNNSIIKGRVLRITPGKIEYDPDGPLPFKIIERNKVRKIIYSNKRKIAPAGTTQKIHKKKQNLFERAFSPSTKKNTNEKQAVFHDEALKEIDEKQNNSSSVESLQDMFTLRTFCVMSDVSLAIRHHDDTGEETEQTESIDYYPNVGVSWGMSVWYKGLGIGFSFDIGGEEDQATYGKTTARDLQLFYYTRTIGVELYYQKFKGYYINNPEDFGLETGDPETLQPGLTVRNIGLNAFYNFNDQFSLEAAFHQTERQTDWEVAFLIMVSANYITIDNDSSLIPASEQEQYGEDAGYKGGIYKSIALAPGIGITIPFYNFYLTGCLFVGTGIMNKKDSTNSKDLTINQSFYKFNGKFGAGYNGDNFFCGLYAQADSTDSENPLELSKGVTVSTDVYYMELFAGIRI